MSPQGDVWACGHLAWALHTLHADQPLFAGKNTIGRFAMPEPEEAEDEPVEEVE